LLIFLLQHQPLALLSQLLHFRLKGPMLRCRRRFLFLTGPH
jgi:hypothetical protein